ncbi:MAG TPA: DNA-processing protein DprA [Terracidiphilus sp.]|nr:DNA-processing protein DprA [Terracidiphilus sp.]
MDIPSIKTDLTEESLAALYVLDALKGFGPQKFKLLWNAGISPRDVIKDPALLPLKGKIGDKLRKEITKMPPGVIEECAKRAEKQLDTARRHGASIVTYGDPDYPPNLLASPHPVPVLYVRGNAKILHGERVVACVGSRKIQEPYSHLHRQFVKDACATGFIIASGFALGADTVGHRTAFECGGQTICVMPGGLDRPFPPENRPLWNSLLEYKGGVFVSEFAFGTSASALTLRKRNKVIVALSRGVLVSQSSLTGGAMNAFRFALEQKKSVATFESNGSEETTGNEQITSETKVPSVAFPKSSADVDGYRRWLNQLSSSI